MTLVGLRQSLRREFVLDTKGATNGKRLASRVVVRYQCERNSKVVMVMLKPHLTMIRPLTEHLVLL